MCNSLSDFIQTDIAVKILNPLTIAWLRVEIRVRENNWGKTEYAIVRLLNGVQLTFAG